MYQTRLDSRWLSAALLLPLMLAAQNAGAGALARAIPAAGVAVPYVCIDTGRSIKACVPRRMLFSADQQSLFSPMDSLSGTAVGGPRDVMLVPGRRESCNVSHQSVPDRAWTEAVFVAQTPGMRLGFDNFAIDMDVDADVDGFKSAKIRFGYRNCWL